MIISCELHKESVKCTYCCCVEKILESKNLNYCRMETNSNTNVPQQINFLTTDWQSFSAL